MEKGGKNLIYIYQSCSRRFWKEKVDEYYSDFSS